MEHYVLLRVLGEGTFGRVYLARDTRSSALAALKKVRVKRAEDGLPKVLMREIQALEKLSAEASGASKHVVQLREHFAQGSAVVLALEYMQADLQQVLSSLALVGHRLPLPTVRVVLRQLLSGVAGVHAQSVLHRDLKPSNLLFSPEGVLKIGDFGLARVHEAQAQNPNYSHEVATRWYRSPELLFGARAYGQGVDVWACGAIFAELLNGAPLFAGHNDIDQLYRVLSLRGTPTATNWPSHASLPDYGKIAFPHMEPRPLRELVHPETPQAAVELLDSMLALDPARRISAAEALRHPFFQEQEKEAEAGKPKPRSLHASEEELLMELAALPALVKQWEQEQQQSISSTPPHASSDAAALPLDRRSADGGASSSSTAAAAASSGTSASASEQLRRLHLHELDWTSSRPSAFQAALQQLPPHVSLTGLKKPATVDDICPC